MTINPRTLIAFLAQYEPRRYQVATAIAIHEDVVLARYRGPSDREIEIRLKIEECYPPF